MNIWEYTLCLCCTLSSVGFMRLVFDDAFLSAPLRVAPREVLLVLTVPATMWLAHLLNDRLFAGTKHAYTWSIVFSLFTALSVSKCNAVALLT